MVDDLHVIRKQIMSILNLPTGIKKRHTQKSIKYSPSNLLIKKKNNIFLYCTVESWLSMHSWLNAQQCPKETPVISYQRGLNFFWGEPKQIIGYRIVNNLQDSTKICQASHAIPLKNKVPQSKQRARMLSEYSINMGDQRLIFSDLGQRWQASRTVSFTSEESLTFNDQIIYRLIRSLCLKIVFF